MALTFFVKANKKRKAQDKDYIFLAKEGKASPIHKVWIDP
jgi:hypothetical protein